jgi:hypothetical protein
LLWLFWRWGGVSQTIYLGWSRNVIFPMLASPVAKITGMSHWCLDFYYFFFWWTSILVTLLYSPIKSVWRPEFPPCFPTVISKSQVLH